MQDLERAQRPAPAQLELCEDTLGQALADMKDLLFKLVATLSGVEEALDLLVKNNRTEK